MTSDPPPPIQFASDTDIACIARRLEDRTLPKPQSTHAAHFGAALWFLAKRPVMDVARQMPAVIRAYNAATGVANTASSGYHETITLASIRAARAQLRRHPGRPVFEVANALMASDLGRPGWLLAYWSRPRLMSAYARLNWCEPDIARLPF